MRVADALIASGRPEDAGLGYALRSVLRFDGSDRYMGMSANMLRTYWIVAVPIGVVYDVVRLPVQAFNGLSITEEDMELASRDIDEARRLGVTDMTPGRIQLFGRGYRPIDRTSHYVEARGVR